MTFATSLLLIAVGAILKYAVTWDPSGVDLGVVGVIFMIVGAVGLVLGLFFALRGRAPGTTPPSV